METMKWLDFEVKRSKVKQGQAATTKKIFWMRYRLSGWVFLNGTLTRIDYLVSYDGVQEMIKSDNIIKAIATVKKK